MIPSAHQSFSYFNSIQFSLTKNVYIKGIKEPHRWTLSEEGFHWQFQSLRQVWKFFQKIAAEKLSSNQFDDLKVRTYFSSSELDRLRLRKYFESDGNVEKEFAMQAFISQMDINELRTPYHWRTAYRRAFGDTDPTQMFPSSSARILMRIQKEERHRFVQSVPPAKNMRLDAKRL